MGREGDGNEGLTDEGKDKKNEMTAAKWNESGMGEENRMEKKRGKVKGKGRENKRGERGEVRGGIQENMI